MALKEMVAALGMVGMMGSCVGLVAYKEHKSYENCKQKVEVVANKNDSNLYQKLICNNNCYKSEFMKNNESSMYIEDRLTYIKEKCDVKPQVRNDQPKKEDSPNMFRWDFEEGLKLDPFNNSPFGF